MTDNVLTKMYDEEYVLLYTEEESNYNRAIELLKESKAPYQIHHISNSERETSKLEYGLDYVKDPHLVFVGKIDGIKTVTSVGGIQNIEKQLLPVIKNNKELEEEQRLLEAGEYPFEW